jgi:hypothetical protein
MELIGIYMFPQESDAVLKNGIALSCMNLAQIISEMTSHATKRC